MSQNSDIHLSQRAQIALLKANETPTSVLFKYIDFADVVSKNIVAKLSEYTGINNHAINQIKG